jgi:hypothetical protein
MTQLRVGQRVQFAQDYDTVLDRSDFHVAKGTNGTVVYNKDGLLAVDLDGRHPVLDWFVEHNVVVTGIEGLFMEFDPVGDDKPAGAVLVPFCMQCVSCGVTDLVDATIICRDDEPEQCDGCAE